MLPVLLWGRPTPAGMLPVLLGRWPAPAPAVPVAAIATAPMLGVGLRSEQAGKSDHKRTQESLHGTDGTGPDSPSLHWSFEFCNNLLPLRPELTSCFRAARSGH